MNEELKPCPFCGANDPYHEISEDEIHVWIACGNCFATSSRIHTEHHTAPDFAWNTRPIEDSLTVERDEWREKYEDACIDANQIIHNLNKTLELAKEAMEKASVYINHQQYIDCVIKPALAEIEKKGGD